jgi:hypothetical protein
MSDNGQRTSGNFLWMIPEAFTYPLITGLLLLLGAVTVLLFNGGDARDKREVDRSERVAKQMKQEPSQEEGASSKEAAEPPPAAFRVSRSENHRYTFHLNDQLEEVQRAGRVNVSLYWQEQPVDQYDKQVLIKTDRKVNVEWSPGRPGKRIPPGVYRIRIASPDLLQKPPLLSNITEYLSKEEQKHPAVRRITGTKALEYAVSVGSRKEVRAFHRRILCELKKRGRTLVSAWKDWFQFAQSAYDEDRDRSKIAQELFDRFMEVNEAVRVVRSWIEKQEGQYVLLPYRNLRGELLKLSYVLGEKVNALSMTVLRQVGISPWSWPGVYVRRGFGSNINVLRHMSQYDRDTIRDVETAIANARIRLPYDDLPSYGLYRLKRTFEFVDHLQVFQSQPYRQIFEFHLYNSSMDAEYQFRSLKKYVQQVIRMKKRGLDDVVPNLEPKSMRTSVTSVINMLPAYSRLVFRELATSVDLESPGTTAEQTSSETSAESMRTRIKRRLRQMESRLPSEQHVKSSCQ